MNHPLFSLSFDRTVSILESYRNAKGHNPGVGSVLGIVQHLPEECLLKNVSPDQWSPVDWQGVIAPCLSKISMGGPDTEKNYAMLFSALKHSLNIPEGSPCRDIADVTAVLLKNKVAAASQDVI